MEQTLKQTQKIQTIAIWGACHKVEHIESIVGLFRELDSCGVTLFIEEEFFCFISQELSPKGSRSPLTGVQLIKPGSVVPSVDIAICIGGDGTFLRTVHRLASLKVPIWAVNCGRLGFLMDVDARDSAAYVPQLLQGSFRIEERSMIQIVMNRKVVGVALNELAIQKRETGSLIQVKVALDDVPLADYAADGLIISTPTGSTAYSLSLGGPIVSPGCEAVVLTPIAPHSLNIRPFVIPNNQKIALSVSSRSASFAVVIDGVMQVLPCGTPIEIVKAQDKAQLIRLVDKPFTHTLRDKMMWGQDLR